MLTASSIKRALIGHGVMVCTTSFFLIFLGKGVAAESLVYGGGLAVVNALVMLQRIRKGLERSGADAAIYLQLGFLFRFLLFMLAIGFAAKYLSLDILMTLVGFMVFQAFVIKEVIQNLRLQGKGE